MLGLLAGLTVPVGAALEMVWLPRWSGAEPGLGWARAVIGAAAAVGAGVAVVRYLRTQTSQDQHNRSAAAAR